MHHLVVAQRQHEALAECVCQPEGQFVVMQRPQHRITVEVLKRVVHPAQVPLVRKPEPAVRDRMSHFRPCGALFRDHHRRRHMHRQQRVEFANECDRFQILDAAMDVRRPLASLT